MEPKSAIAKGKRYENYIAGQIRMAGLDSGASREIASGSGKKKGDIRAHIPFLIEAKNEANVPKWLLNHIDQSKRQAERGFYNKTGWALVIKDPRSTETNSEDICIIDFQEFLGLLQKTAESKISNPKSADRSFLYKVKRLKQYTMEIIKDLEKSL